MEDLLIALALLAFALFNWVFQKGGLLDKLRGRGAATEEEPQEEKLTEEERHRQLMEALGMPVETQAPPPVPVPRGQEQGPLPPVPEFVEEQEIELQEEPPVEKQAQADAYSTTEAEEFSWDVGKETEFNWQASDRTVERMQQQIDETDAESRLNKAERDALAKVDELGGVQRERLGNADYSFHKSEVSQLKKLLFKDRQALQRAILAKEILDEPRGLQEIPGPVTIYNS